MRIPVLVSLLAGAAMAMPTRAAAQDERWSARGPEPGDTLPVSAVVVEEAQLTRKPSLVNRAQVFRALNDNYPAALREQGITGQAELTLLIDPSGVPRFVTVSNSSGRTDLDTAAIRVMRRARFSPSRLNEAPVWVRVRVPVVFSIT